ncbi:MAG: glycosyltransferase family 4 protein [Alphaproteobacteria bacterium]
MTTGAPAFTFIFPGDPETLTGGYTYGRRIVESCRASGVDVTVIALPDGFPEPDETVVSQSRHIVSGIPDGTLVVFDGLAFGALPDLAADHGKRLRFVALVHHPLADETGLSPEAQKRHFERERTSLTHARCVIVSSPFTKIRLQDFGVDPEACFVVEPGIDDAPFNDVRPAPPHPRLLYVASLTERKGHLDLFKALQSLQRDDWSLNIVGPDDLSPEYGTKVLEAAKPFGEKVRFHGALPEAALADLYRSADLYVSPARYEGYGMALATAVVYGLPIVAVNGGAVASTPAGKAARLVSVDDIHGLAQALQQAMKDPTERARLSQQSRAARMLLGGWMEAGQDFLTALRTVGSDT